MSKPKKSNKVLVRNPSVPLRPCQVIEKTHGLKKVHFSDESTSQANPTFEAPQFCTLLQLAEEVKAMRRAQPTCRSLPEFAKHRNVDFPPEEKLYKDLIDLDIAEEPVTGVKSQPSVRSKKDPELDINKYTKYNLEAEYIFTFNAVPLAEKQKKSFNGRSIYNKLTMWKDEYQ